MRCCYKYIRGLLMTRHARTNCFLLFAYNQSLPQFGTTGQQQNGAGRGQDWDAPQRSGLLNPSCSSLSCPEKTGPSLPLSLIPLAHPSLLPFPANFLKESSVLTDLVFSSLFLFVHYHLHGPPNTPCPDPHSVILCPTPGPCPTPPFTQLYVSGT